MHTVDKRLEEYYVPVSQSKDIFILYDIIRYNLFCTIFSNKSHTTKKFYILYITSQYLIFNYQYEFFVHARNILLILSTYKQI